MPAYCIGCDCCYKRYNYKTFANTISRDMIVTSDTITQRLLVQTAETHCSCMWCGELHCQKCFRDFLNVMMNCLGGFEDIQLALPFCNGYQMGDVLVVLQVSRKDNIDTMSEPLFCPCAPLSMV